MNLQNLNYLKDNLKYLGFGEKLYPELEKNIQQRFPEFVLKMETEIGRQQMTASLHFRRPENSDMYFFNSYRAELNKGGENLSQMFYVNKGQGVTLKEAYNMMNGRAVNKDLTTSEGNKYNAWIQLDFNEKDNNGNSKIKQYHENYGYDLQNTLAQYPIKELQDSQQKEMLIKSLEKGNSQSAFLEQNGSIEKVFIAANPQYKTLNFSDVNGKMIKHSELEEKFARTANNSSANAETKVAGAEVKSDMGEKQEKVVTSASVKTEPDLGTGKKNDLPQQEKQQKTSTVKKVKEQNGKSLLPKKRTGNKKSMGLA